MQTLFHFLKHYPLTVGIYFVCIVFALWLWLTPTSYELRLFEEKARDTRRYKACIEAYQEQGKIKVYEECGRLAP